jgi:hypothetical protein
MKKVYKYTLKAMEKQILEIPSDTILSAESQKDDIVVYALVNTDNTVGIKYEFRVYGTGHDIEDDIEKCVFVDTVKMYDGVLMFHVFYKKLG